MVHDHEACFYSYGCGHQECMVHIERHLRDSIENEKNLTWNGQMLALIQKMIHENNIAPAEGIADEKISEFEARYDAIVQTATKEYEDDPPSDYYRDGYNLYLKVTLYGAYSTSKKYVFIAVNLSMCYTKGRQILSLFADVKRWLANP